MKLDHEFYKLPLTFDIKRLQQEVLKFQESDWHAHHENFKGNFAVPLISVHGEQNNDFKGPMHECDALKNSPYIRQVLSSFNEVFGRSRLMSLAPGCEVPTHSDINYHWYKRVRIHIPIITNEEVIFHCGDKNVHMGEGECWIFDSWKTHKVVNSSKFNRIHLVIDTCGSSNFWQMVKQSETPNTQPMQQAIKHLDYTPDKKVDILTERYNAPIVMSPGELDSLITDLHNEITINPDNDATSIDAFKAITIRFSQDWRRLWTLYGESEAGWPFYHKLRDHTVQLARNFDNRLLLTNESTALQMLIHCVVDPALSPEVKQNLKFKPKAESSTLQKQSGPQTKNTKIKAPMSRNSPCECGSGKKYKQCCGSL